MGCVGKAQRLEPRPPRAERRPGCLHQRLFLLVPRPHEIVIRVDPPFQHSARALRVTEMIHRALNCRLRSVGQQGWWGRKSRGAICRAMYSRKSALRSTDGFGLDSSTPRQSSEKSSRKLCLNFLVSPESRGFRRTRAAVYIITTFGRGWAERFGTPRCLQAHRPMCERRRHDQTALCKRAAKSWQG